jgi:hypothetical protein
MYCFVQGKQLVNIVKARHKKFNPVYTLRILGFVTDAVTNVEDTQLIHF